MSKIAFVCCIEAGRLENQTCLMISTLRKFGGASSQVPVYAVLGRTGPKISSETIDFLIKNHVKVVSAFEYNHAPWFNFSNKIAAVMWAQDNLDFEYLGWLDSDILINGNFLDFCSYDFDFAGRCEYLPPAIRVNDDKYVNYFIRLCELVGCKYDEIPWVVVDVVSVEIKLNFNSGFFVWRRNSKFAVEYSSMFYKLLESKIATPDGAAWFADQVIIAPLLIAHGMNFKLLSFHEHHMIFYFNNFNFTSDVTMENSKLIHYSKSLSLPSRDIMLRRLKSECPHIYVQILDIDKDFPDKSSIYHHFHPIRLLRKIRQKLFANTVRRIF